MEGIKMETQKSEAKGQGLGFKVLIGLMALMIVGFGSAAVVTYLSNTASASVSVESPMEVQFAQLAEGVEASETTVTSDLEYSNALVLRNETALNTIDLGVKVVNKSDVKIEDKVMLVTVSNDLENVDLADITSLKFFDVGASESSGNRVWQELSSYGTDNGSIVTYAIPINSLASGTEYDYPVTLTFGNVAPSNYNISATLMVE